MAILTIIKEVKKVHPKELALVKVGNFVHSYGKDSYILSFLFGYKIKVIENNCSACGFPQKSLPKVQAVEYSTAFYRSNLILLTPKNYRVV